METQAQQVLAGSLNLLPPADMLADQDAIALQNWRVDQQGALRSRKGCGSVLLTGTDRVHAIMRLAATPDRRYFAQPGILNRETTVISTLLDQYPPGLASMNGWGWCMNRGVQVKDNGSSTFPWSPAAPAAAPTDSLASGGSLNGDVSYWVTFDTAAEHESNPSPALDLTALVNEKVTITCPTPSSDAQITTWNLYRQDTYLPDPYKVNTSPIPIATTTFLDDGTGDSAAENLAARGEMLSFDHDPAPAARGCCTYQSRVLAWNTALHPNRLFWSLPEKPWCFPGSADEEEGNWTPVGEEGEELLAVAEYPTMAVILKSRSIHRLVGDPDETWAEIDRIVPEFGVVGPLAWCRGRGSLLYFRGPDGVYRLNGDQAVKVSGPLDPLFKGDVVSWPGATPVRPVNSNPDMQALERMGFVNGRLYYSYADDTSSVLNTTLVYDEATERWYSDSRPFDALRYDGTELLGAIGKRIYAIESGLADGGAAIPVIYQSRYFNQGAPENDKTYCDVLIEHNTGGATLTVEAYLGHGSTIITLGTISSTSRTGTPFRFADGDGVVGRNISIRVSGSASTSAETHLFGIFLHYYVNPRAGLTWDSGKVNLGSLQVKQMDTVAFDVEAPAGASLTWQFYTDLPGDAVTLRDHGTKTAGTSTTLHRITCPLAALREGRWIRLVVTSTQAFQIRGAYVNGRVIGVYLAGTGDVFRSDKVTAGNARLKLWREMRVYCHTNGTLTGDVLSDVPGEHLVTTVEGPLDTTITSDGARWMRCRFGGSTRGRAVEVRLCAEAAARIYQIQVRVKVLGEGMTGWTWVDVPVAPTAPTLSWLPIQETP
jgi:hypothetical protein